MACDVESRLRERTRARSRGRRSDKVEKSSDKVEAKTLGKKRGVHVEVAFSTSSKLYSSSYIQTPDMSVSNVSLWISAIVSDFSTGLVYANDADAEFISSDEEEEQGGSNTYNEQDEEDALDAIKAYSPLDTS